MVDLAWPNDLGAATAVWQLFRMGADNWDADRDPQLKAAHETIVEFTPDLTQVVRYEGEMGKASIEPMISRGIINREGQLCTMNEDGTAGPVGVVLPATNSDTITPKNWTYRATITKNRVRVREFSFPAPAGEDVDLADYIEIEPSGGTHIITEIETAERAEAAASDAERYRNETRADRQAAQTARTGAETAETNAKGHATSASTSASSAAEILTNMENLQPNFADYEPVPEDGVLFNALRVRAVELGGMSIVTVAGGYRVPDGGVRHIFNVRDEHRPMNTHMTFDRNGLLFRIMSNGSVDRMTEEEQPRWLYIDTTYVTNRG